MFTGLVQEVGYIVDKEIKDKTIRLWVSSTWNDVVDGESISVSGACLTVISDRSKGLGFDLSEETMDKTAFAERNIGDAVNLERALLLSDRLGGHWVSGHIDTTAYICAIIKHNDYILLEIDRFNCSAAPYLIPKGCITVDGVNLTINAVTHHSVSLMLVPYTLAHTTLEHVRIDQRVNIEFDNLAKIVAHQMSVMMPEQEVKP